MSTASPPPELPLRLPTHKDLPSTDSVNAAESRMTGRRITHRDLPESDGKPVENTYRPLQAALLTVTLNPVLARLHADGDFFTGSNTAIYWRLPKNPLDGCKAPDWFYVANVPHLLEGEFRRSYVMWDEVISPVLVVECVSGDGTDERDATPHHGKFWVYEQAIRAAFYVIWDPFRVRLEVFELIRNRYQPVTPAPADRYRIPPMEMDLGIWEGMYQGCHASWLRAWDWNGNLIPTPDERAELEQQQTLRERERAEQERLRAERLANKLRELGVDPDSV